MNASCQGGVSRGVAMSESSRFPPAAAGHPRDDRHRSGLTLAMLSVGPRKGLDNSADVVHLSHRRPSLGTYLRGPRIPTLDRNNVNRANIVALTEATSRRNGGLHVAIRSYDRCRILVRPHDPPDVSG